MLSVARAGGFRSLFLLLPVLLVLSACGHIPSLSSSEIAELKHQAEAGDPVSQYQLGLRYTSGTGVWKNNAQAVEWFEKSAYQGHADAAYMLGIDYYTGRGVAKDYRQAAQWFQRAAVQGHARAQYQLAAAYMNGQGVIEDQAWAARWYGKAANQGHSDAQFSLGVAFARGLGLPVHPLQACKWLVLAGRSGSDQPMHEKVRDKVCSSLTAVQRQRALRLADNWRPGVTVAGYTDQSTVFYIQYRLAKMGYDPGYVDGYKGPKTASAIDQYLKDSGLPKRVSNKRLVTRLREAGSPD